MVDEIMPVVTSLGPLKQEESKGQGSFVTVKFSTVIAKKVSKWSQTLEKLQSRFISLKQNKTKPHSLILL